MAYRETRQNAEETVFEWREDHPDQEGSLEFDSYDPSTTTVFVEFGSSEVDSEIVTDLEQTLRDKFKDSAVIGVVVNDD